MLLSTATLFPSLNVIPWSSSNLVGDGQKMKINYAENRDHKNNVNNYASHSAIHFKLVVNSNLENAL